MIDTIITSVRPALRRYARLLPERHRDDATQEATIEIWRHADLIAEAKSPEALAMHIGKRAVRRFASERAATGAPTRSRGSGRAFQRSTGTISSDELTELGIELADAGPDLDLPIDVARALAALDPEDSFIVLARFWLGLTWREIGELTNLSVSGVFNRWDRARPALASALSM